MRILGASIALVLACGAPPKKEGALVKDEGSTPTTCCCKTIPVTDDKEITPAYTMGVSRMECSTQNGECVDDVQCNGHAQPQEQKKDNGVPPPPPLAPSTDTGTGIP